MAAKTHEAELRYVEEVREALGLTDRQIAGAIGISERTLHRSRSGGAASGSPSFPTERIDVLREFHQRLLATMPPEAARAWLQGPAHALDGHRPVDLLEAGRTETLIRLLIRLNLGLSA